MRTKAEAKGLVLFSHGCFAHKISLMAENFCAQAQDVTSQRKNIVAFVHFRRLTRTRDALTEDVATDVAAS